MARGFGATSTISPVNSYTVDTTTGVACSVWFYPFNNPGASDNSFMVGTNGSNDLGWHHNSGTNQINYGWTQGGTVADTGLYTKNTWVNVTLVFGDSIYFNGSLAASNNPGFIGTQTCQTQIGGFAGNPCQGYLSDYAVWVGVTLTAGEIKALAKGVRPYMIHPGKLVVYWPMDTNQSPELDMSGKGNNGTLNNSPTFAPTGPPVMNFTPRWPQFLAKPPNFINLGAGNYSLTDESLKLFVAAKLSAFSGFYALTGEQVLLPNSVVMKAAVGTYQLGDKNVILASAFKLGVQPGLYQLIGEFPKLTSALLMHSQPVVYLLVENNLKIAPPPPPPIGPFSPLLVGEEGINLYGKIG